MWARYLRPSVLLDNPQDIHIEDQTKVKEEK